MKTKFLWFGIGLAAVLVVKYAIAGVKAWTATDHSERMGDSPAWV